MIAMNPEWRMPAAYLKLILQDAQAAGLPATSLLEGTPLSADQLLQSDQPVGFDATLNVLRNATDRFGPGWHLQVGQRLTLSAHGALGFAVVTAPTLRASMNVLLRFMGTRAPFLWSAGATEGDEFVFRFFDNVDMSDQRQVLIELAALSLQGLVERPLGREMHGATLSFAYDRPVYADALAQVFHAKLVHGADRHALRLPLAWLETPCALYDEAMHRYLLGRCEEEMAAITGGLPAEVAVRQALLAKPGTLPTLAEVAAGQHISCRTLIRRLKSEGSSFRRIRDHVRQTLSRDYLLNSDMSISRIAWRLGYQDPSNFSRAFRRWHGVTPRAFRDT